VEDCAKFGGDWLGGSRVKEVGTNSLFYTYRFEVCSIYTFVENLFFNLISVSEDVWIECFCRNLPLLMRFQMFRSLAIFVPN